MKTGISTAGSRKSVPPYRGHRNGFTLLELIVVMVIMTIMLGVVGPRFIGGGGGDLARFSKRVAAYLRNARELSVVRNVPITVEIDEEGSWITCMDEREEVPSLSPIEIPEMIRVTLEVAPGLEENTIVFYPLGNATESRVVLERDDGRAETIEIEGITGKIYIE